MGLPSYPDEERTIHHRSRASPTAKFLRYICQVMLFFMCLAVVGGIIMGVIALSNTTAINGPDGEGAQARHLLARSYYGNITASGNVIPTGTAPVSMNNATVVVNTATGAVPSVPSPSATLTVNGVGAVGATEASTEASTEVGLAANATVTITSTSTTITNTRTVTQAEVFSAAAVASSSGASSTPVFFSKPASDCAPATVTLTVTKTAGGAPSAQITSTSKAVTPFTTLIIPDLYSKGVRGGQSTLSSQALNGTTQTAAIQEATETAADGNNLTTTVTVFEQPTVIVTSTMVVDDEMSSSPAIPTGQIDVDNSPCVSKNVTAAATGTVGALNKTMTALETITVQPANPPSPEPTQTASSNGTSPVIVSEGAPSKQGKRAGSIVSGCLVMVAATILCML